MLNLDMIGDSLDETSDARHRTVSRMTSDVSSLGLQKQSTKQIEK